MSGKDGGHRRQHAIFEVEERPLDFELIFPVNYDKQMPPKLNTKQKKKKKASKEQQYVTPKGKETKLSRVLAAPRSLRSINKMTVTVSVSFYIHWSDDRIRMKHNSTIEQFTCFTLQTEELSQMWKPLLGVRNAMKEDILSSRTQYYDGHFRFNIRNTMSFHCALDLHFYPMDVQECSIQVQALNYKSSVILKRYVRIYEFTSSMAHQDIRIAHVDMGNCSSLDHFERYYSCVEYRFTVYRQIRSHLILTFLPSGLVVTLSWVSFWLDSVSGQVPRITLGSTTLLTLITQFRYIQEDMPKLSYLKAVDVWMLNCVFMVFASLIEFVIVYDNQKSKVTPSRNPLNSEILEKYRPKLVWYPKFEASTNRIDRISRSIFPLFFFCFNLIFWCYYGLAK